MGDNISSVFKLIEIIKDEVPFPAYITPYGELQLQLQSPRILVCKTLFELSLYKDSTIAISV